MHLKHDVVLADLSLSYVQAGSDIIDYSSMADTLHWQQGLAQEPQEYSRMQQPHMHVCNPAYDYVGPEHISLFVTDTGGYTPSYVYRLLAEYYTREDYGLSKEALDILIR